MGREAFCDAISIDVSRAGARCVLDSGGRRLTVERETARHVLEPGGVAKLCRFLGERVVLLFSDGAVRTVDEKGALHDHARVREGATGLAALPSGTLAACYGSAGVAAHGITLERFGHFHLMHAEPALDGASAMAAVPGGIWLAGTSRGAARVVRLRPVAYTLKRTESHDVPAPARAAVQGPDGALFLLLEPGDRMARIGLKGPGEVVSLDGPLLDLARGPGVLIGCAPDGPVDLTGLVPRGDSA